MALQGDLSSFALPDVLHLLAATAKSGCLGVCSPPVSGEVWLYDGQITGGEVSTSPHTSNASDVVMELLRLDDGEFLFDDGIEVDGSDGSPVDDVLGAAQSLLAEWHEVEAVVPTLEAWISLMANLDRDEVTLHADQWQAVAAVGGGATVAELAERCELTDLAASQMVRDLADARLVSVGEVRHQAPASTEGDGFDAIDTGDGIDGIDGTAEDGAGTDADHGDEAPQGYEAHDRGPLAELSDDDAPVLLADGDGSLLPEPLFEEPEAHPAPEIAMGAVDGRSFEAIEEEAAQLAGAPEGEDDNHPFGVQAERPADEDRGSLLRFLSTVEP